MTEFYQTAHFWDHVEELRQTLIKVIAVIVLGTIISLFLYQPLFDFLSLPLKRSYAQGENSITTHEIKRERISNKTEKEIIYSLPPNVHYPFFFSPLVKEISPQLFLIPSGEFLDIDRPISTNQLFLFGPLDGMATTLRICCWVGLVGTSPIWGFFILQFIAPAIEMDKRRQMVIFFCISLVFLLLGLLLAFFVTIPIANQTLLSFNKEIGTNLWSFSSYLDYTFILFMANALAFEMFVIFIFLVHQGYLHATSLINRRKHAIVGSFVMGAILTPPDVLTQLMLAIPLICLYEITILYARFKSSL